MARPKTAPLTRAGVVDAAIDIIGADGLEAFSMAGLARRLGIATPSLYHHFADKDALMADVARAVVTPQTTPTSPEPGAPWSDHLVEQAVALRSRICARPHCAPLLARYLPSRDVFIEYDQVCRSLASAGVPAHLHVPIVDGLTALTIGAAVLSDNAAHYTVGGPGPTPDRGQHPALCVALDTVRTSDPDEQFRGYLRTYLAGVLARPPDDP